MSWELWLGFLAASAVLLVSPGQIVLFTVGNALARGPGVVVPIAVGAMLGDAMGLSLSLLGVGGLIAQWPDAARFIRISAGAVLIVLGALSWRQSAKAKTPEHRLASSRALAPAAFAMTALHPMGIVFFAAFIPAFTNPQEPLIPQWLMLAATFVTLSMLNIIGWGLAAAKARDLLSLTVQASLNRLAAAVMILIGVMVLVSAI